MTRVFYDVLNQETKHKRLAQDAQFSLKDTFSKDLLFQLRDFRNFHD